MKEKLKLIIKQIIAEEFQKEGKGYLRGAALGALLALGGSKLAKSFDSQSSQSSQVSMANISSVADLAKYTIENLRPSLSEEFSEAIGVENSMVQVIEKINDIENLVNNHASDEALFEALRVLTVRLERAQRAGFDSEDIRNYILAYRNVKSRRNI